MNILVKFIAVSSIFIGSTITIGAKDYFARDFGAKPDGVTLNTASLQAAIDFASAQGGGRVVLDKGGYVSGTVYLKSNVILHIEKEAALLSSLNPYDFVRDQDAKWTSLVFAIKQNNVGVTGEGMINGRGFYIRHADGVVFDNVRLTVGGEDYRPAIVTDDVNGLRMKNLQINQETAPKGKKQIITKDTKNIRKK